MNWRRIRRWLLGLSTVSLCAFVGVSWFICGKLISPANRIVGPPPKGWSVESITIDSESGSLLAAWHIAHPNSKATVILLHPIRSDRRSMLGRAKLLYDAGFSTLLVDLQAHGESPGDNITAGFRERHDVMAAVDFVRARSPNHKIGIIGRSLGGAAALMATPLEIDALVLESVYPTIAEAVHDRVSIRLGALHHVLAPALLIQLQARLGISPSELRPIDHIADVNCPVLIAAGDVDVHTTIEETQRIFDSANEPKELVVFSGAGHVDLLGFDEARYRADVLSFIESQLLHEIK